MRSANLFFVLIHQLSHEIDDVLLLGLELGNTKTSSNYALKVPRKKELGYSLRGN